MCGGGGVGGIILRRFGWLGFAGPEAEVGAEAARAQSLRSIRVPFEFELAARVWVWVRVRVRVWVGRPTQRALVIVIHRRLRARSTWPACGARVAPPGSSGSGRGSSSEAASRAKEAPPPPPPANLEQLRARSGLSAKGLPANPSAGCSSCSCAQSRRKCKVRNSNSNLHLAAVAAETKV